MRNQEGEGQQSRRGVGHHVHRWSISAVPESTLEVFENRGEQTIRVYARDARGLAILSDSEGPSLMYLFSRCARHGL